MSKFTEKLYRQLEDENWTSQPLESTVELMAEVEKLEAKCQIIDELIEEYKNDRSEHIRQFGKFLELELNRRLEK